MKSKLMIAALIFSTSACSVAVSNGLDWKIKNMSVTKHVDSDENVVCYIWSGYSKGGISCLKR